MPPNAPAQGLLSRLATVQHVEFGFICGNQGRAGDKVTGGVPTQEERAGASAASAPPSASGCGHGFRPETAHHAGARAQALRAGGIRPRRMAFMRLPGFRPRP